MGQKTKLQLIKLIFIKKIIESLKKEEKQVKLEIDEQLRYKESVVSLLNQTELKVNLLSNSLEKVENNILQYDKTIHEKTLQKSNLEDNTLHFQKKRDFAYTSLESIDNMNKAREKTIQDLKDNLESLKKRLTELEALESTSQLDDEQVLYIITINKIF